MKKQRLSIAVADLHQYEPLLKEFGLERSVALLEEACVALGDIALKRGGQIRKYIGDAMLFTFAEPRDAAQAAREMAAYRREVGEHTVRFFVGAATGEVLIGPFGHPALRMEDVFGETVNRAFRLLKDARSSADGVALDDETAEG